MARFEQIAEERAAHRGCRSPLVPVDESSESIRRRLGLPCQSTMLDLIRVVQPKVADTGELVAVVRQLVAGGTVDLCGSFRGERP